MKLYFKGNQNDDKKVEKGRGLTVIRDILKDFENESDFAISDNSRINDSSVLKSVQNRESNLKVPPSVNADDKD